MIRITTGLLLIAFHISAYADVPDKIRAPAERLEEALLFSAYPDMANIYVKMNNNNGLLEASYAAALKSTRTVPVALFPEGADTFMNIQLAPGVWQMGILYHPRGVLDTNILESQTINANFDLAVEAGAVVLVDCFEPGGFFANKRSKGLVLQRKSACPVDKLSHVDGATVCLAPYSRKSNKMGREERIKNREPIGYCVLSTNKDSFRESTMINSAGVLLNIDYVYKDIKIKNTLKGYETFLEAYPDSEHSAEISGLVAELKLQQVSEARQGKITQQLQLDASLPLAAKRDKYMLSLTAHLKQQSFEESLFYFELLERLNVELSDSFNYFWGEALLRTDNPKESLEKLYNYINSAGSTGKYYTKALELTNEAQAKL
jgi:hypothetical protein